MKKILIILIIVIVASASVWYFMARSVGNSSQDKPVGVLQNLTDFVVGGGSRSITVINDFFRGGATSSDTVSSATGAGPAVNLSSKFQPVSSGQISGASLVTLKTTLPPIKKGGPVLTVSSSTVWYMERSSGYLFSYDPAGGEQQQISNTTWPGIAEIYWGQSGATPYLIARYLKNGVVENYLAKVETAGTSTYRQITGSVLISGISTLAISPDKTRYFYLISSLSGSVGYLGDLTGKSSPLQIFSSPFPKWQVSWPSDNLVLFQSAPSFDQAGLVYGFNLKTKSITKIIGGENGLTALASPDSLKLAYSHQGDNFKLRLKRLNQKDTEDIDLGIATLPEKCVWAKSARYLYCSVPTSLTSNNLPDSWYQGTVAFTDSFWRLDTTTGTADLLFSPDKMAKPEKIDGVNLFLSAKEDKLFLTDKTTGRLWQLLLGDSFATPTNSTTTSW